MSAVRYVLIALQPGVEAAAYERFWREVDHPTTTGLASVVDYRLDRVTEAPASLAGGPWDYVERFEVMSRAAFQEEAARAGQALVAELYGTFLERAKTVAWWSEPVAP